MQKKINLEMFDLADYPREMLAYLKNYGFHFNKKACEMAVKKLMRRNPTTGKNEPIEAKKKEEIEQVFQRVGLKLENNTLYDFVWVYNMLMSDYWKSAIEDEVHLCKAVKDMIDDPDQCDGFIFNRWISDRMFNGDPIEWSDIL